ncbi:hypothetical protein L1987_60858 [Smallanthus sonchifolius]|uniref:Uncharacterized protein n=1 Tax=Smallanthus sonchifolius TaxID=185202 RepID=A0ACB9D948_9ASTR|nr:hypothetical protein L1987_60858 [Smallanthus sonchifolius]
MVRDWVLLCSEKREFELLKREFEHVKRELQDSRSRVERVKKLEWDLSTSREETARARELHQKVAVDWKTACGQANAKLAKAVDADKLAASRVSAIEAENKGLVERLALRDTVVVSRDSEITRLRAQLKEMSDAKDNESAHRVVLEIEVQVLRADRRWLISECIPHIVDLVKGSPEFQLEGLDEKIDEFDNLSFGILKDVTDCADHPNLSGLKAILAGEDEESGPSRCEEEVVDYDRSDDEEPVSGAGAGAGDGDAKA